MPVTFVPTPSLNELDESAAVGVTPDGLIRLWGLGAELLLGWSGDDIVGMPLETIIPVRYREAHLSAFGKYRETGELPRVGFTIRAEGLHRDGTEVPIEVTVGVWHTEQGWLFLGALRRI